MADGQPLTKRIGWMWRRLGDVSTLQYLWALVVGSGVTASRVTSVDWHLRALVATWFFGSAAVFLTAAKCLELGWRRLNPPTISFEPHGGNTAALVVTPSSSGRFYGTLRFIDKNNELTRPYRLFWGLYASDPHAIRAGDHVTLVVASVDEDRYKPRMVVHGDDGEISHNDLSDWAKQRKTLAWISFEIELRAQELMNTWKRRYRFRLTRDVSFEIEEITP